MEITHRKMEIKKMRRSHHKILGHRYVLPPKTIRELQPPSTGPNRKGLRDDG